MTKELQRARRRQMLVFLLVCVAMLGLLGRLYYWQVIQGPRLSQLANDEHVQSQKLAAPRGLIYDVSGHILATNVIRDDVYIEPKQFALDHENDDADHTQAAMLTIVRALHQVMPDVSQDDLVKAFSADVWTYRVNIRPIEPTQREQLEKLQLADVFLQQRTVRTYPGGDLASQILGFVGADGSGLYGIEGQYNTLLAGKAGSLTAETDLNGNPLTVGASSGQAPVPGANITLTIDSAIQYLVQNALVAAIQKVQAKSGTVIVLNAKTGAVVAMAGAPDFDPNQYGNYASVKGCNNTVSVYLNPALFCDYEPGSTMKSVTMAAGLDQHLITPDTSFMDNGVITLGDAAPVANWAYKAYGNETMTQVLEHSANVGAAYVAYNFLHPEGFYPYLTRFGFGQPFNIDGPEQAGYYRVPTSNGWSITDLTRQAFGQAIATSPFQMAMVYEAIANGGVMMNPYIVASTNDNGHVTTTQPGVRRRVISAEAAKELTSMLISAANYNQNATFPGYSIAVKTGTATTQGISDDITEASMAGFVPASNPQYVILVKLDQPSATLGGGFDIFGGVAAGPLWRTVAQNLMQHYNIPPDE